MSEYLAVFFAFFLYDILLLLFCNKRLEDARLCSKFNELKLLSLSAITPPTPLIRRLLEDLLMLLVEPCLLIAMLPSLSVEDPSENIADSV